MCAYNNYYCSHHRHSYMNPITIAIYFIFVQFINPHELNKNKINSYSDGSDAATDLK